MVVVTEHVAKDGSPKIVTQCTLLLTGSRVVQCIVSDHAVLDVGPDGLVLGAVACGTSVEDLRATTDAPFDVDLDAEVARPAEEAS